MSRTEPFGEVPRHPSAWCTVDCTSPQNAPWPAWTPSRSSITTMLGARRRDVVEVVEPLAGVEVVAELDHVLRADGHRLAEPDHRRQVGKRAVQMPRGVAQAAPLGVTISTRLQTVGVSIERRKSNWSCVTPCGPCVTPVVIGVRPPAFDGLALI